MLPSDIFLGFGISHTVLLSWISVRETGNKGMAGKDVEGKKREKGSRRGERECGKKDGRRNRRGRGKRKEKEERSDGNLEGKVTIWCFFPL